VLRCMQIYGGRQHSSHVQAKAAGLKSRVDAHANFDDQHLSSHVQATSVGLQADVEAAKQEQ
jgi:hypothetical protein